METYIRTFRGFDTEEDAITFKRFLISIGYEKVDMEYNALSRKWRIWFEC